MTEPHVLSTTAGDLPLEEVRLDLAGRCVIVLHGGAVLSDSDEERVVNGGHPTLPYGVSLWPAAIALAHELGARTLRGQRVLELGAGTGLPGVVAAALGARVVQTDLQPVPLHICRLNALRNGVADAIEHRRADWTAWDDVAQYDLILGSDILYAPEAHPHLRRIFDANLAPGGRLLLSDPFRRASLALLERMEASGWSVSMSKWTVGFAPPPRDVGVFDVAR